MALYGIPIETCHQIEDYSTTLHIPESFRDGATFKAKDLAWFLSLLDENDVVSFVSQDVSSNANVPKLLNHTRLLAGGRMMFAPSDGIVMMEDRMVKLPTMQRFIFDQLTITTDVIVQREHLHSHGPWQGKGTPHIIDAHVSNLRSTLGSNHKERISTVRGEGFIFRELTYPQTAA